MVDNFTRRGALGVLLAGAAGGLMGCDGKARLYTFDGADFSGFDPSRNTVILFAAANRIDLCVEGADVFAESVALIAREHDVVVVMPDIQNTQDHRTLNQFRDVLEHPNFEIVTGSNDDVAELAQAHGADYLFMNDEVLIHTPYPFILTKGASVAQPLNTPLSVGDLLNDVNARAVALIDYDAQRYG